MSKEIAVTDKKPISAQALASVILGGDLSVLKPEDKVIYYNKVCEVVGLNPLTKPFDYIVLNRKEVLYANKGCSEQLREIHHVSIKIVSTQTHGGVYVVVVEGSMPGGRVDSATGAVAISGLSGEALANAFMKCETKAKRRLTLSICGLNMLDETEVASIPGAMSPAAAGPAIAPKAPVAPAAPGKPQTRDELGAEIVAAKKKLNLSNVALADWAKDKFGKAQLTALTDLEMAALRDDLLFEIGRA